ncbi:hypothetical protein [Pseudomonas sp.]|uniref:hypothetical protein n=1 Tax=Pseudomonas sp. TaxID=306 RepID=UPI003266D026
MTKSKSELKWLRTTDNEWQWAEQYLDKRVDAAMRGGIRRVTLGMEDGYSKVVTAIAHLEKSIEGLRLVTRLRSALRQHRYRLPSNGKKPCTFSLPNSTRANLSRLAKTKGGSETAIITMLIDEAEWMARKHNEREKGLKTNLTLERKRAELALEAVNAQLEQTLKHLELATNQLVMWELAMESEHPPFDGDQEKVSQEVEKRLKKVKTMNTIISLSHSLPNEELES